jgi:hypothetical protein
MNKQEAKQILSLYRPGTADEADPCFSEARRWCEQDPELQRWFEDHCAVYTALRAKFRQTAVPEGLKEQILAERKVHLAPRWRRRPTVALAALAVLGVIAAVMLYRPAEPREDLTYAGFVPRMVSTALRTYQMDLETGDLDQIRAYCRQKQLPADYTVPTALANKAGLVGCANISWQRQPVTMICYKSGKALPPGQLNDLWLFVFDGQGIPGTPVSATPLVQTVNRTTTATWTANGKTYLLVADGDEEFLREYL